MAPLGISIRRRKDDNTPELFFYSAGELSCYAHIGQHSAASLDYYRECTKPADPTDADCAALIREWSRQPPRIEYRIVRRLTK